MNEISNADIRVADIADALLRDYFAGHALVNIRSDPQYKGIDFERQAKAAYALADAMMRERSKQR